MEHSVALLLSAIFVQLVGATIALGSVRRGERAGGWLLLCAAFVLMAVRRVVTLSGHVSPPLWTVRELFGLEDAVALGSSLLLVAGVIMMRTRFHEWRRTAKRAEALAETAARGEQNCRGQNEFLNNVLASLTHPFYVVDAHDYTVKLANAASHLNPHDGSKVTCYALTHGRDVPCEEAGETCPLAVVRRTKAPVTVEHVHQLPDGSVRHVDVHGHPIFDERGDVVQMIEYNLDVTEQRLAERALRESETRWRAIVESEPECVKVLDAESRVVEMNPAGLEMIEASIDDVRGKPASALVAEEDRAAFLAMVAAVFRGEKHQLVFDMIGLKGRRLTLETVSVPFRDPADPGRVKYLLGVTRDITERRRAEEQANQLAAIVRSSPDAIVGIDMDGVVTSWNRGAEAIYQYLAEEIVGKSISVLLPPGRTEELPAMLERMRSRQFVEHFETRRRRKDGSEIEISLTLSPVPGDDGRIVGAAAISRDITERKLAEAAMRLQSEIAANIADGIYLVSASDLRIVYANPTMEAMFGYAAGELIGQSVSILNAPGADDPDRVARQIQTALRNDRHYRGDVLSVKKDGTPFWSRTTISLMHHPEYGDVYVSLQTDLTERKRAEEALKRSEAKFRAVVENSYDGVVFADAEGVLLYRSPSFGRITGFADEERLGRSVFEVLHPDDAAVARRVWAGVLADRSPVEMATFRVRHRDGSWRWLETSAENLLGDPNVRAIVMTSRDVTDRRRLEDEMRRAAAAMEQAGEAIVITDTHAVIQYVNPAFTKVTGYTREEAIGQNPRVLQSGRHGKEFYSELWGTLFRGETWTGRFTNRKKDGSLYEEEASIAPVRDEAGTVAYYVAVKRDITHELELQDQISRTQRMEALGSFASGIAHDFNNLIMIIRGTGEYVIGRLDPGDPLRAEMTTILRSAGQAGELTGGLLSFARRQVLRPEVVRLDEVVRGILPMLRRLIPEHCEVRFDAGSEIGHVRVDLTHFEQVLLNLCVNARDAMPAGGTLTLAVANAELSEDYTATHPWAVAGRYVAVTVRDTGIGMDTETLARIFEPFFTTKEVGRGTGLGLATAYGLVKQHGGVIDVVSEPGRGSAFTIYLPQVGAPEQAPSSDLRAESLHGRGEHVLVVEDQPELRRLLARTLEEFGYRASEAADGAEALARIGAGDPRYDLILTDLVMPTMGGLDLYRRVRAAYPRLPLLISSGYGDMGDSYVLPDDPYLSFLAKPYEVAELARVVRSLLDRAAEDR